MKVLVNVRSVRVILDALEGLTRTELELVEAAVRKRLVGSGEGVGDVETKRVDEMSS